MSTADAAEAIHDWLLVPDKNREPQIRLGPSESRPKTVEQMMKIRTGACGELCTAYVHFLRKAGIKARHCALSYKYGNGGRHYYVEYWDKELNEWTAVDASVERSLKIDTPKKLFATGAWNTLACYAYPEKTDRRDLYHTSGWDACINVTANVCPTYPLKVIGGEVGKATGQAQVLVWNDNTWRCTVLASWPPGADSAELVVADTKPVPHPALFTQVRDGELWWALQRPSPDSKQINLEKAQPGVCLRWGGYE